MSKDVKTEFKRSPCPLANMLDIVGDKWTLLIVRDLFLGKSQYKQFLDSPEKIPTNILADRLLKLQEAGIIDKNPYQEKPLRYAYSLTPKGRDLKPIIVACVKWGNKYIEGTWVVESGSTPKDTPETSN